MSLDDKLREILDDYADNRDINRQHYLAIGADKYLEVRNLSLARLSLARLKQALADDVKEKLINGEIHGVDVYEVDNTKMTGQEWEQKALKEGWRRPNDTN